MARTTLYFILFLLGIMVGYDLKQPEVVTKMVSSPVEMVFEGHCIAEGIGKIKMLTIEDLSDEQ